MNLEVPSYGDLYTLAVLNKLSIKVHQDQVEI